MIVDGFRLLTAQLTDPTTGVNALLAAVPRDALDPAPPDVLSILDETSTPWLARYQLDGDVLVAGPALLVTHHAEVDLPATVHDADRAIDLLYAVTYAARSPYEDADSAAGSRDAWQTLRAAYRSTVGVWLNTPSAGGPVRLTRNGVAFSLAFARFLVRGPITADGAVLRTLLLGLTAADPWMQGYV